MVRKKSANQDVKASSNTISVDNSWIRIGTVVGNTSTNRFTFILRSFQAKLGDIVACYLTVPGRSQQEKNEVIVWGRIVGIDRYNPFFPAEAAQELAEENIRFLDTVLSNSRDHLEAEVIILGTTIGKELSDLELSPLTYPVQPSCEVLYPPADAIKALLTGKEIEQSPLHIGSLIGRSDVDVNLSAKHIVSRHLAILAMTGGGKTVAARRIIRELINIKYPLVIFDPHGDYLGFFEKQELLGGCDVKIFYPKITVEKESVDVIVDLITKMGSKLTDPQQLLFQSLVNALDIRSDCTAITYLQDLINLIDRWNSKESETRPKELSETRSSTFGAVRRNLTLVKQSLEQMEKNNERLRKTLPDFVFDEMPDPGNTPERIVCPGQLSIFYLAGYDHLTQSAIVSLVLEQLFHHRATLSNEIAPFQAVIEEAHNFIPSRSEGLGETPSLNTIRKVITEGRKFGTGLLIISQRPARLDDTTLAQCNSFLVLRLVNPRDKSFVRSVMENLSESDANILQTFGPGQGLVSGQAVKFPLLVKIKFDEDLISKVIGDEDFISDAQKWKPSDAQKKRSKNTELIKDTFGTKEDTARPKRRRRSKRSKNNT